ncbi:MAG: CRISPR system precrRNA processing endoribonuclease RAMP protein Cas6 [Chloroflexi bacterium]|nr:CRISPR system precrRNA processing endoribonuclease RAMP protein Cas6 [Chloroflexota bacterium]
MFLAAVIPLTPLAAPAARFYGREAHALFLDLVRRADPALAQSLHEPRGDKPFTVAPLPLSPTKFVEDGGRGWGMGVRFTAFEPRLAQLLAQNILPMLHAPREIRLGSAMFATGAPLTDRAAQPWAGASSAEELMTKWFQTKDLPGFQKPGRSDRVTLEFLTPTAHRQIHRNILFPLPAQLWGGWLRAWNAHAQPAFEDDLIARVEQDVAISHYDLKTALVDFGEHRAAGWVGRATFTYFNREPALWRVLNLLADFAFFCGTGYKTTQGMGMTRPV